MELAPLFVEQRWNILKHLASANLSPLQLANMTKTTIANVSQQLRLLEAADLVKKEKIPNRDKGQPRTIFSLSDDYAYIISLMNKFADKKLIRLTNSQQRLLKILSISDSEQRTKVENIYFKIFSYMDKIDGLAIDFAANATVLVAVSDKQIKKKLDCIDGIKTIYGAKIKEYLKARHPDQILPIQDPHHLFYAVSGGGQLRRKVAA